jgi:hypothetical protein
VTKVAIAKPEPFDMASTSFAVHKLKCWTKFFDPIHRGEKRHDLRRATDRNFRIGDHLMLQEFDPEANRYTGRNQLVEITYITSSEEPCALSEIALNPDFCILSIAPVSKG